jgi:hypothetical protein
MKKRAGKYKGYENIKVCKAWQENFEVFYEWAKDKISDGLSLDRIDNKKGYSPQNCRFTNCKTQIRNRNITLKIYVDGKKMIFAEYAEQIGVNYYTLYDRMFRKDRFKKAV